MAIIDNIMEEIEISLGLKSRNNTSEKLSKEWSHTISNNSPKVYDFKQSTVDFGQNLIVYGTPGCGKSYYVENNLLKDFPKKEDGSKGNIFRTTFFQDYTNTDFIGQILPMIKKNENGDDIVTYEFNPGPFTLALEQAIKSPNMEVALVIEELNRGNAASIFGDIFQLLDRFKETNQDKHQFKGVSVYSIFNRNIIDYLNKQFFNQYVFKYIKLPSNLSIFATMNTCDQNVFTLDSAFKRRWEYEKLNNDFKPEHDFKDSYIPGADITWQNLVDKINNFILSQPDGYGSEDKQIGVYFVDKTGMRKEKLDKSNEKDTRKFAYKILEYLWDDVAKFNRSYWFNENINSLDKLIEEYCKNGIKVFKEGMFDNHEQK